VRKLLGVAFVGAGVAAASWGARKVLRDRNSDDLHLGPTASAYRRA
jgi:hypothetical protein